jgi:hypothetical protein
MKNRTKTLSEQIKKQQKKKGNRRLLDTPETLT